MIIAVFPKIVMRNIFNNLPYLSLTQFVRLYFFSYEGRRIENILQSINLTTASLSQSGLMSLRTLANLALTLETKDASDTR